MVNFNAVNLANSENGYKGRITINEIDEPELFEPYDPNRDNETQNHVPAPTPARSNGNANGSTRNAALICCGYSWFMVVYFLIDHVIQLFRKNFTNFIIQLQNMLRLQSLLLPLGSSPSSTS
jgi:hypothetical protein